MTELTEETVPLTPLSNHDNEGEGSNQMASPSNKRLKKQRSQLIPKKVKTLEKTHKYKSWV